MRRYRDDYGNSATIEVSRRPAYKGGALTTCARLTCKATYDHNYTYYVSCFDAFGDALDKLSTFSCGTFREV